MKYSEVTTRRLNDGATSIGLQVEPLPDTLEALASLRDQLYNGMVALQSLDDLGSEDANQAAYDDMLVLQYRYDRVVSRILEISKE
jgi:hypothetical protein